MGMIVITLSLKNSAGNGEESVKGETPFSADDLYRWATDARREENRVGRAGQARPPHTIFTPLIKVRPTSRLIRGRMPHLRQ